MGPHPPSLFCASAHSAGDSLVVLGPPKLGAAGLGTTIPNELPDNSRTRISEKLRVSKFPLADRNAATTQRSEMPNRSREARAHTRTALPQVPGSMRYASIQYSKLQHLFTKEIIRTGVKSVSQSDTQGGLEDRCHCPRLIRMNRMRWPRRWNRSRPSCRKLSSLTIDRKRTARASYWQMAVAKRVECRTQVLQNEKLQKWQRGQRRNICRLEFIS